MEKESIISNEIKQNKTIYIGILIWKIQTGRQRTNNIVFLEIFNRRKFLNMLCVFKQVLSPIIFSISKFFFSSSFSRTYPPNQIGIFPITATFTNCYFSGRVYRCVLESSSFLSSQLANRWIQCMTHSGKIEREKKIK